MPIDPAEPFPPYAFVPGGPWPHPSRGHSAHAPREAVAPIVGDDWAAAPAYLRGIALFNAGYYWEAHEAWEALWHAHGRRGPIADLLKALIKLAAAGVKVREGQPRGVTTHARRASALFEAVAHQDGGHRLGLDLRAWSARAEEIAGCPPTDPAPPGTAVSRVFMFEIEPDLP